MGWVIVVYRESRFGILSCQCLFRRKLKLVFKFPHTHLLSRKLTANAPEKWWLEDSPFLLKWSLFRGHSFIFRGSTWWFRKFVWEFSIPESLGTDSRREASNPKKHSGKLTQTWKIHYFHWSYQERRGFSMVMLVDRRVVVLLIYVPGATWCVRTRFPGVSRFSNVDGWKSSLQPRGCHIF